MSDSRFHPTQSMLAWRLCHTKCPNKVLSKVDRTLLIASPMWKHASTVFRDLVDDLDDPTEWPVHALDKQSAVL